ncbi:tetraacyldisaccharide 4'-kinase [Endozoicomonas sp. OPT23]|uniref:tetraacyldisaccharide 4'-kinase n=1 Tax=Endozoicomonas sp. OPT23 TaxID=2072845 RepID=UPI00129BB334|nr:tetraacyldisaccharide 4'-kinase [Endozoicomonas sp. OPT23]MRI35240.1 tetraacyldisaccharide 4'-kinase [Endozoicomonas sp. OPT23]
MSIESRRWKDRFSDSVLKSWYSTGGWTRLLLPLSWLYQRIAQQQKSKKLASDRWQPSVPVIVVGNISVGGTGKTPVVASLVKRLQSEGYRPGIASRGFGSSSLNYPLSVTADSDPKSVGDEPVMLASQTGIPVMVDPNRVSAAKALIEQFDCDLIIADDGLQHYNLVRHIELAVVDGARMLGNQLSLPAGPLRELPERLETVDLVLVNGQAQKKLDVAFDSFYLQPDDLKPVIKGKGSEPPEKGKVHGVAGIGNPERFFLTLEQEGYEVIPHPFPDHHDFSELDLQFGDELPVLMTAKDAVKCRTYSNDKLWYLPVQAHMPESVFERILTLIETKGPQSRSNKDSHG